MWPWEHVAIAYVIFSLAYKGIGSKPPQGTAVWVLVMAALLPDAIDKPLAWQWNIFETGYGLGHSIFFAIPLTVLILGICWRANRPAHGIAFAIGYLSHLVLDVVPLYLRSGRLELHRILWPIAEAPQPHANESFLDGLQTYLSMAVSGIGTSEAVIILVAFFGMVGLWILDGMPGRRVRG